MAYIETVIVTWNKKKYVLRLLEQLKNLNYPQDKIEIIVVDNNSSDGTAEAVELFYPHVRLIKNPENRGGAGGFNAGMLWVLKSRPDCEYLWLLDNDVLVHKNALQKLVEVMEKNPRAAICGSKIMDIDRPHEMIEIGAFIDYRFGDVRQNVPPRQKLQYPDAVFEVDYVAACSLLARTRFVKEMGIWHEKFFIYWDDMEWGARFKTAGYKVLASNASIAYHPSWGKRIADNSAIWRNYYRIRNALWFYNNYSSGLKKRFLLACMILRYMRYSAGANIRAQTALSRAYVKGVKDFFNNSYGKKNLYIPPDDLAVRMDFEKKKPIAAVEKMNFRELCRIPFVTLSFLFQVLLCLPEKDASDRRAGLQPGDPICRN